MNKKNIIIIGTSLILGLVAIIAGFKLYQLRQESIAPTEPGAVSEKCTLEFTVSIPSLTPTLTPTPTGTLTPTPTGTLTPTPTGTLTPTPTTAPTNTPAADEPTSTPAPSEPTTTPAPPTELPSAGGILPTIGTIVGGVILGILGLLLAL